MDPVIRTTSVPSLTGGVFFQSILKIYVPAVTIAARKPDQWEDVKEGQEGGGMGGWETRKSTINVAVWPLTVEFLDPLERGGKRVECGAKILQSGGRVEGNSTQRRVSLLSLHLRFGILSFAQNPKYVSLFSASICIGIPSPHTLAHLAPGVAGPLISAKPEPRPTCSAALSSDRKCSCIV